MNEQAELLPDGARLVHIGPFKTGSTAIQQALSDARPRLVGHGVLYPGKGRRQMRPGWAVLQRSPRARTTPPIREWQVLLEEVESFGPGRVCVSTEDFGSAGPEQARRIVADLGGERVHVVAVSRRFDRLLPSYWQERVKSYDRRSYDEWLHAVLEGGPDDNAYRSFWASHDLAAMLARWLPAVGASRFHLVVADESDRELLRRTFEAMLGLPDGLLRPEAPSPSNPSLTLGGTELVRRFNELFVEHGWPDRAYHRLMQRGAIPAMAAAPPSPHDVPIPALPAWALGRVEEMGEKRVATIESSGIRVVGDPASLLAVRQSAAGTDTSADGATSAPQTVPIELAARALEGAVSGALELEGRRAPRPRQPRPTTTGQAPRSLQDASGRELVRALVRRARDRVARRPAG